jgi:hypothetical protein
MKGYLQLFSRALSSAQAITAYRFPDPIDAARHLLASSNESERKLGLRKLRSSESPDAVNLAVVSYRFAASPSERMRAEECLVALSSKFADAAGDTALEILTMHSRSSCTYTRPRSLRRSVVNLSRVLESDSLTADDAREIDQLLRTWERKTLQASSAKMQRLLDQLCAPWGAQRKADELAERSPEVFKMLNARLHLTYVLQAVKSEAADKLRVSLLQDLEPGAYADVVFRTLEPHVGQVAVRKAVAQLLSSWIARYGEACPVSGRIEGLLATRSGIAGPPQYFG